MVGNIMIAGAAVLVSFGIGFVFGMGAMRRQASSFVAYGATKMLKGLIQRAEEMGTGEAFADSIIALGAFEVMPGLKINSRAVDTDAPAAKDMN